MLVNKENDNSQDHDIRDYLLKLKVARLSGLEVAQ